MNYEVTISGKIYRLPPRTLSVDEEIEKIGALGSRYVSKNLTRREAVEAQHAFVEHVAPGALPCVDEVDVNELLKACLNIITVYNAPAVKAQADASMAEVKDLVNRPEMQKAILLAQQIKQTP